MSITQRFDEFLEAKNINRPEFCRQTGYSFSNLSNFLAGRTTNPRIDLIHAITSHFPDFSINWLFLGEGAMWLNKEGESEMQNVSDEEPEDPEKELLKDELLSMYKRRVQELEREIRDHAPDLAGKLEL